MEVQDIEWLVAAYSPSFLSPSTHTRTHLLFETTSVQSDSERESLNVQAKDEKSSFLLPSSTLILTPWSVFFCFLAATRALHFYRY